MDILNQYSYVISSLFVLFGVIAVALVKAHDQAASRRWPIISSFVFSVGLVLFSGFFVFRPGAATVDTVDELDHLLDNNRPTLLQFYSNYCIGCMSVESELEELELDISTTHDILRVDIHTDFGREIREVLGVSYTPEFVLYDPTGQEIWRGHELPPVDLLINERSALTATGEA